VVSAEWREVMELRRRVDEKEMIAKGIKERRWRSK
jgi:hypothetical protein